MAGAANHVYKVFQFLYRADAVRTFYARFGNRQCTLHAGTKLSPLQANTTDHRMRHQSTGDYTWQGFRLYNRRYKLANQVPGDQGRKIYLSKTSAYGLTTPDRCSLVR